MSILVLGGTRSGKSRFAESLASNHPKVNYIATGIAVDDEMKARIERHRLDRPEYWHTIEEPINLADSLNQIESGSTCILIDCLSFWVNNCLFESQEVWIEQKQQFFQILTKTPNPVIMVSNEVGMGITPMGVETRLFVDELGRLHQELARQVDTVVLMVAGIPQILKGVLSE